MLVRRLVGWDAWGLFERFTERARQAVILGQEEARELRHGFVGSEHILLGLLGESDGLAARVLGSFDVSLEAVRAQVTRIVAAGEEPVVGEIPFTPRAEQALELALREALSLGHDYIRTEHLLLGLVRGVDGVGVRILRELGADPRAVRNAIRQMVARPSVGAGTAIRSRAVRGAEPGVLPIDAAWLGVAGAFLPGLTGEIREQWRREPDSGDLLLALAYAPDELSGQILRALGLELDELPHLVERMRAASSLSDADRIEAVRQRKESAIEAGQHQEAQRLREEERALTLSSRERRAAALDEIRRHLGISVPTEDP